MALWLRLPARSRARLTAAHTFPGRLSPTVACVSLGLIRFLAVCVFLPCPSHGHLRLTAACISLRLIHFLPLAFLYRLYIPLPIASQCWLHLITTHRVACGSLPCAPLCLFHDTFLATFVSSRMHLQCAVPCRTTSSLGLGCLNLNEPATYRWRNLIQSLPRGTAVYPRSTGNIDAI